MIGSYIEQRHFGSDWAQRFEPFGPVGNLGQSLEGTNGTSGFITLNIGQKCPAVDTLRQWRSPNYCLKIFEYSLEHCDELNCEQIAINGFAGPRVSVVISDMPREVTLLKFNLGFLCFYKYSAQHYHVANSKNHQKVDGAT